MTVIRLHNPQKVKDFLALIGPDVIEDGVTFEHWVPDMERSAWIGVYDDDLMVGLCKLVPMGQTTLDIHPSVLPEARGQRHEIVRHMLDWIWSRSGFAMVCSFIPVVHRHVKRFAVEMGMTVQGRLERSYRKNGELVDQWVMGMPRPEGV